MVTPSLAFTALKLSPPFRISIQLSTSFSVLYFTGLNVAVAALVISSPSVIIGASWYLFTHAICCFFLSLVPSMVTVLEIVLPSSVTPDNVKTAL